MLLSLSSPLPYSTARKKQLFEYVSASDEPIETRAVNINPYLVDTENTLVESREAPFRSDIPVMLWGSKPVDGGFLHLSDLERIEYVKREPEGEKYLRQVLGAQQLLHNIKRWCLWLIDADPVELRRLPLLMERLAKVKAFRLSSKKEATRRYADKPYLFMERRQPSGAYLAVPSVSSETRKYIPLACCDASVIANNLLHVLANANLYHFGVLQSAMHMAWTRQVCGRLEERLRYSSDLVYNTFPWAENPRPQDVQAVSEAVQVVLEVGALS
ncbi:MAG: type IIL restriction-modification enzyme MmeI [Halobacteriota archaeon]